MKVQQIISETETMSIISVMGRKHVIRPIIREVYRIIDNKIIKIQVTHDF